jgi:GTP diphosphokinase / guanosine-3',5'-bis(diphosphate) 3'-diphosphatase
VPPAEEFLLHAALRFAVKRHRGQDRDGADPLPYATHPIDVVNRLRYVGLVVEPAVLAAAVLHDLVEETETSLEDIESRFGVEVSALVAEVTRREPSEEEFAGLAPDEIWELRSRMLLDEIAAMSEKAQTIKLADRASNLLCNLTTRCGDKRARYIRQSYMILEVIPRSVNPSLWDSVRAQLEPISGD